MLSRHWWLRAAIAETPGILVHQGGHAIAKLMQVLASKIERGAVETRRSRRGSTGRLSLGWWEAIKTSRKQISLPRILPTRPNSTWCQTKGGVGRGLLKGFRVHC